MLHAINDDDNDNDDGDGDDDDDVCSMFIHILFGPTANS